jgi:DNA-binding NtrC family response regulator
MLNTILVVEDDKITGALMKRWFTSAKFRVVTCVSAAETVAQLEQFTPSLVCLDLGLPDVVGLQLALEVRRILPFTPVIILTADGSAETAVRALQAGATDYLVKPVDRTRLLECIQLALRAKPLLRQWDREGVVPFDSAVPGMAGVSDASRMVREQVRLVGAAQIDVLIEGPSGAGKELVARGIHMLGAAPQGPFIAINCAALSDSLLESELFGHERHSFTGADRLHPGRFEQAHGGTLFLDEVAELSLVAQGKLLRVLQERRFYRVGGTREVAVDLRLIAATNRSLKRLVEEGRFRADLFFRLAVYEIKLLPLRERREDILPIVDAFLAANPRRSDGRLPRLADQGRAALRAADWDGNVRELQNVLRRAMVHMDSEGWLSLGMPARMEPPTQAEEVSPEPNSLVEAERLALLTAVGRYGSDVSGMAKKLGVGRSTLYRKLKEHGLRIASEPSGD